MKGILLILSLFMTGGLIANLVIGINFAFAPENERPYNKTYLDEWIKEHGCNCTNWAMEQAARLIDQQTKTK
jgi:hypothetical protein